LLKYIPLSKIRKEWIKYHSHDTQSKSCRACDQDRRLRP